MQKIKDFIFDLDGTLVGAKKEHRYILVGQTLNEFGVTATEQDIDKFWFEARRDEVIKNCFGLSPESFWEAYRKYDTVKLRKQFTEVYADVDIIKELKKAGRKTGIVTGAPLHIAAFEIGLLGRENFDAIVIANERNGIKPKPHPHGLEECLSLLKAKRSETAYVGNADEDIETARNAQVFDVLVVRGEHEFPELKPSLKINSLYELRRFISLDNFC